jgi:hypothetical protein
MSMKPPSLDSVIPQSGLEPNDLTIDNGCEPPIIFNPAPNPDPFPPDIFEPDPEIIVNPLPQEPDPEPPVVLINPVTQGPEGGPVINPIPNDPYRVIEEGLAQLQNGGDKPFKTFKPIG